MIYLDHSATTPVDPRVLEAMIPWLSTQYGNPSSIHLMGRTARVAIEDARSEVADLLGAHPAEILFTSGGTEGNNTILYSILNTSDLADAVYCSAIEHHSVLDVIHSFERKGAKAGVIPVDHTGLVDLDTLATLNADRVLVAVMLVNNEIGVTQDIAAIRNTVPSVLLHSDIVQAVGKVPVHLTRMNVDLATISAHKVNGPKGVGAMFVRKGIDFKPVFLGGGQERNRRAGTENVASIIGFQVAMRLAMQEFEERVVYLKKLTTQLVNELLAAIPDVRINTTASHSAPHIVNISFPTFEGSDGEAILQHLDMHGVCVSNGSACVSGSQQPSHVLKAIGLTTAEASAAVRFSVSHLNTPQEISQAVTIITEVYRTMCV